MTRREGRTSISRRRSAARVEPRRSVGCDSECNEREEWRWKAGSGCALDTSHETLEGGAMISNDYHLELVKAEVAKLREQLAELEALLAKLPRAIAAQVNPHRPATIRERIRELEAEIQQYRKTKHAMAMTAARN